MGGNTQGIRILHVDDEPDFADLVATFLEREDERISVECANGAQAGQALLREESFDCVISDYDMPGANGIEFFEAVREIDQSVPFILYTGKGSEEVASEAITAGVTDYLQKESGTSQYTLLANRALNAVRHAQAEAEAEETRQRYKYLTEESTDVIGVLDPDGTFTYLSPATEPILGYEPDELIGDNGYYYVHPDEHDEATEEFADLLDDPSYRPTVEFRFEQPDGTYLWVEIRARNLLDNPVIEGIIVTIHDISDRKRREQELLQQRSILETQFEATEDGILNIGCDGHIISYNEQFRTLWEIPESVLEDGTNEAVFEWLKANQVANPTAFELHLDNLGEQPDQCSQDEIELADGRIFEWYTAPITIDDGMIHGRTWRFRDITERRERERQITETSQWYSQLLAHSSDYLMVVDETGRVEYVSPSVENVIGYTPEEIRQTSAFELVHPEDSETALAGFNAIMTEPEEEHTVEFRAKHGNGTWRWLEVRGQNYLDDEIIEGIIVNVRDIDDQIRREQQPEAEATYR